MKVIAKAYGDRPLERCITLSAERVAYVVDPSAVNSDGTWSREGVGFPHDSLFSFDSNLFESLVQAWAANDRSTLSVKRQF